MLSDFTFKKLKEQCLDAARDRDLIVDTERREELEFMWQALAVIANTHPNYAHLSIEQVFEVILAGYYLRGPSPIPPKQELHFVVFS